MARVTKSPRDCNQYPICAACNQTFNYDPSYVIQNNPKEYSIINCDLCQQRFGDESQSPNSAEVSTKCNTIYKNQNFTTRQSDNFESPISAQKKIIIKQKPKMEAPKDVYYKTMSGCMGPNFDTKEHYSRIMSQNHQQSQLDTFPPYLAAKCWACLCQNNNIFRCECQNLRNPNRLQFTKARPSCVCDDPLECWTENPYLEKNHANLELRYQMCAETGLRSNDEPFDSGIRTNNQASEKATLGSSNMGYIHSENSRKISSKVLDPNARSFVSQDSYHCDANISSSNISQNFSEKFSDGTNNNATTKNPSDLSLAPPIEVAIDHSDGSKDTKIQLDSNLKDVASAEKPHGSFCDAINGKTTPQKSILDELKVFISFMRSKNPDITIQEIEKLLQNIPTDVSDNIASSLDLLRPEGIRSAKSNEVRMKTVCRAKFNPQRNLMDIPFAQFESIYPSNSDSCKFAQLSHIILDRRPLNCPISVCNQRQIFISEFAKHIQIDHMRIPIKKIDPGECCNLFLDLKTIHENTRKCLALLLLANKVRDIGHHEFRNYLPVVVLTSKIQIGRLTGNGQSLKEYLYLIWMTGLVTAELPVWYTIGVWSNSAACPNLNLVRCGSMLSVRDDQSAENIFKNASGLILTSNQCARLTDSGKNMMKLQVSLK